MIIQKNTATAVADKINELEEFTAEMTGAGGVISVTENQIPFIGGKDSIDVTSGTTYFVMG